MKKNYFKPTSLLLFIVLLITGCQKDLKEVKELNEEISEQSMQRGGDNDEGSCRLTMYNLYDAIHDYSQIDYFSYKNGLADEWLDTYGNLYKIEYDKNKKMKIARLYDGETLVNTIKFVYKNDKVVKEMWYAGNTNQVEDEVVNTYNHRGEMISNESITFDYHVAYTYTSEGNLKSWFIFSGEMPYQKAEYTYRSEFKNPWGARPGIEYSFVYINSAFGSGKNWYSSEKITLYDEEGNPSVYYDQDPRRTTWQSGQKNYPFKASYIDRISGGSITNTFEYENCSGGHHYDSPAGSLSSKQSVIKSNTAAANFKSLLHGPQGGAIPKLKKLEKQLLN